MKRGGYAFPFVHESLDSDGLHRTGYPGMSLRDYLAGQALAGVMPYLTFEEVFNKPEAAAKASYRIANALLVEKDRIEAEEAQNKCVVR